jgi:hypothetical protein
MKIGNTACDLDIAAFGQLPAAQFLFYDHLEPSLLEVEHLYTLFRRLENAEVTGLIIPTRGAGCVARGEVLRQREMGTESNVVRSSPPRRRPLSGAT